MGSPAASKRYREKNREKCLQITRDWKKANPERDKATKHANKEQDALYHKEWVSENREHLNAHLRGRYAKDLQFRLKATLRSRLSAALRAHKFAEKKGSHIEFLECSMAGLIRHLEKLFQPGMSWENYGLKGWHVDHIIPLCQFDLTCEEELRKACHYTNLQPLWAQDNSKKSGKIFALDF